MSATVREIVTDAQGRVGEVAGSGVQIYGEDSMMSCAVRAFNMMFKKYDWPQYRKWHRLTLDGTLGIVTTNSFEAVRDFEDFKAVYRDGQRRPLPKMRALLNPYALTGSSVMYWTSLHAADANYTFRKLQFYPLTSVGVVNIRVRQYPIEYPRIGWSWDSVMHLDRDLLVDATTWLSLATDDLNPGAAEAARNMMEQRYSDIIAGFGSQPILVEGESSIPNTWSEMP